MDGSVPQRARTDVVQDMTGTTVGRFLVHRLLGAGGMGQVYQAEDTRLKRPVAMKRMAPQLNSDEHFRRRFLKEAECASRLSNQHIAGVYDVIEDGGEIFLVMEYVAGQTLRQRLQQPITLDELLDIAVQCATALVAAQAQGIVHRDLKPENIMLTSALQVKILDFGVARMLTRSGQNTTQGAPASTVGMAGTPSYMAPESLLEKEADGRSDIFSLGVTLYEAATGQHPFLADTFLNTAERILHHTPPPANMVNPKISAEFARIIAKMVNKDPAERYATSADLLVDLRVLQRNQSFPTLAPPPNTTLAGGSAQTLLSTLNAVPPVLPLPQEDGGKKKVWIGLGALAVLVVALYLFLPALRQMLSGHAPVAVIPTAGGANPSAQPAGEIPAIAAGQPSPPQPKQPDSLAESKSVAPAASTTEPKKDKAAAVRPTAPVSAAAEPVAKLRTAPGTGGVEIATDAIGARALLTGPEGKPPQECTTPCAFKDLKPGRYTMEVTKDGYRTLHHIIEIQANKTIAQSDRLDPQRASVSINSEPSQAEVFVNGQRQPGLTPTTLSLPPGTYAIAVQKAGFGRYEVSRELKDEDVSGLKFQLVPQAPGAPQQAQAGASTAAAATAPAPTPSRQANSVGWVDIKTIPPGADILVEGASTGHHTPFRLELPPGQHSVTLYLKGYQAVQKTVDVQENQTVSLPEVLSKP